MTTRKPQNSILLLATLGVYLGLVLAGATPQVLANAATAKQFDLRDEIEFADNLDKKPDDENLDFQFAIKGYFDDFEDLIESLQEYRRKGNLDFELEKFEFERYRTLSCNDGYEPVISGGFSSKLGHPKIEKTVDNATFNFEELEKFSDCLDVDGFENYRLHRFKLGVSYDASQLELKISIPKKNARQAEVLSEWFNQELRIYKFDEQNEVISTIYQTTQTTHDGNHVLIVTHLPRAGLDALLASDAK
ncbi:MAG: hypothetical protein IPK98_09340 [Chloracidobacterium sp.]|nr:hypothetical protein [Chloracidobacterium sp.]